MMKLRINFMIQIRMISVKLMTYLLKLMISRRPMKPWSIKTRFVMVKKLKLSLTKNHWRIKTRVEEFKIQIRFQLLQQH
jgi:sulfur relay (sulfurtransferase) DsrC/TusE family protein